MKKSQQRSYHIRKSGIKDKNIDKQILVLHKAMLDKLCKQPELVIQVLETLEQRRETGRLRHGAYLTWYCALEQLHHQPEVMYRTLLEDSPRMRKLRRNTPLAGILSEAERQQALLESACGTLNIEQLFS
ncbi:hypothetical protein [Lacimicrobium alkaliphilum]|uniref:Uncharacterized protein n=1 Tax=Lacimicrobium alkaliphilum TaxID=1526571 RepID=A0ABQ1RCP1_9ALTE|nr:hypothetical protein [Lacimicrobium alkaliphilum]GGD64102.1 hypothetical protein GCM10011357_19350 [Lacimicrobium alkaliphilum]